MIQVPEEIKWLYKQDSINKNFRVSFPNGEYRDLVNADIVTESVMFTESVVSSENFNLGLCEGAILEFDTFFNQNIKNLKIYAQIEIDISSLDQEFITEYGTTSSDVPYPYYAIPYGFFYVDSCKRDGQNNQRKIVAYQNKYSTETNASSTEQEPTSQLVSLTNFETMKFNTETVQGDSGSTFPINYQFNPLLALCGSLNDVDWLLDLKQTFPQIYSSVNIQTDFTIGYSSMDTRTPVDDREYRQRPFSYMSGFFSDMGKLVYSLGNASVVVYGMALNITCLKYLNKCRGRVVGTDIAYNYEDDKPMEYLADLSHTSVCEFNWDVNEDWPLTTLVSSLVDFINSIRTSRQELVSSKDVEEILKPSFSLLGWCTDTSEIDMTVEPGYSRLEAVRYQFENIDANSKKLVFSPNNWGVYEYSGVTIGDYENAYPNTRKLGCFGYTVFIPIACKAYKSSDHEIQHRYARFLDEDSFTIKTYTFDNLMFNKEYTRKRKTLKCPTSNGTITATAYDAASILLNDKSDTSLLNLQNTFNAVVETSGAFVKFDRFTGSLKFINPFRSGGLYPSEDLYPLPNSPVDDALYPSAPQHLITRSMWKSVWYDDLISKRYKRVIANYTYNNEQYTAVYNVIPEEEQALYSDLPDYDISNNAIIKEDGASYASILVAQIGEALKNIVYYPAEIEMRAIPYMEAGDSLSVVTQDSGFSTFCLRQRISGIHALMDNIEAR